jgi:AraC family transcriptional regulator
MQYRMVPIRWRYVTSTFDISVPSLRGAVAEFPAGATLDNYASRTYEFVWVTRGSGEWVSEDIRLSLRGQLLLMRPGMTSGFVWDRDEVSRHGWIEFVPGGAEDDWEAEAGTWPLVRPLRDVDPMLSLCTYVLWLIGTNDVHARSRAADAVSLLMSIFVHGPVPGPADDPLPEGVHRAIEHVRERWRHALGPVTVHELASAASVSRGHLSRLFREHVGVGPVAAFERLRLARAATLLARTSLSVKAVADACGFASQYHFSRRFKDVFGIAPRTYRQLPATSRPEIELGVGFASLARELALDSSLPG